jgi:hypothetical protein
MGFKWGQVASVSPLTVRLDGSSTAVPVVRSLVDAGSLTVGAMVRCELAEGKVVVYGLPGGDSVQAAWVTFTPDFQNITLGNGTKTGRLRKEGKTVDFWARFQLQSTSVMGTNPFLNLPYTGAGGSPSALDGYMLDNLNTWMALMPLYNGTSVGIYYSASVGGINQLGPITATAPITWTAGDYIEVRGRYESAT